MVENSCITPSIETSVIAEPTIEDNKVLLSEFPNVCPKPRSNGSRTTRYSLCRQFNRID